MRFCRKRKSTLRKNWSKAEGGDYPSANLPKWRFSLFYFFFKSNIKFSSANLLLTKKTKQNWRIWAENQTCGLQEKKKNLNGADFVPESKFHHCSLCGFQQIFRMLCFVSLNKCFRVPITEYGPRKRSERRILVCCFNSIKGVLQSSKKESPALFRI